MPSHKLLVEFINHFNLKQDLKNKTLIEIGSTREINSVQNSSEFFVKFS